MKFRLTNTIIALSLLLVACGGDDEGSPMTGGDDGEPSITASYTANITTNFTEANFPQDYPSGATFGTIVAITHAPDVSVYSLGQIASEGFKAYVENGDVDALGSFISGQLGEENEGKFTIQTEETIGSSESKTFNLSFSPIRTRVTIVANLNPSPDWFIGINSFDITDGDSLIENETVSLRPLDGGSSTGDTYNAPDGVESNAVSIINGPPFSMGAFTQDLGTIEITRIN